MRVPLRLSALCPNPPTENKDQWSELSLADAVPVVTDAVPTLVGNGGKTTHLIEGFRLVIVGMGDRGDGEASVMLFGPDQHVNAAWEVVEVVAKGA